MHLHVVCAFAAGPCEVRLKPDTTCHRETRPTLNESLRSLRLLFSLRYGTTTIGARQKATFCAVASSTVTWQSYGPGDRLSSGRLNRSGTAFVFGSSPSVTASGVVSNAFTSPR